MPSVFEEAVNEVKAALDVAIPANTIAFYKHEFEPRQGPVQFVVWVNAGGTLNPGKRVGGLLDVSGADPKRQDALHADLATVEAYIVSDSHANVNLLHYDVLRAAHSALKTGSQPLAYVKSTQSRNVAPEWYTGKHLVIQTFQWSLVVPKKRAQDDLTEINAITEQCGINPAL